MVGASEEFESATVQATVSGVVEAIVDMVDPAGQKVPAVVIKNDGNDTWAEELDGSVALADPAAVMSTRPSRLLRRLREAGLVRAQVEGRPLHVGPQPAHGAPVISIYDRHPGGAARGHPDYQRG